MDSDSNMSKYGDSDNDMGERFLLTCGNGDSDISGEWIFLQ